MQTLGHGLGLGGCLKTHVNIFEVLLSRMQWKVWISPSWVELGFNSDPLL